MRSAAGGGDIAERGARARGCALRRGEPRDAAGRAMTDASNRKEGFKKCRSATFSIDGYSFTIGENFVPSVRLLAPFPWLRGSFLSGGRRWSGVGRGPGALARGAPGSGDRVS